MNLVMLQMHEISKTHKAPFCRSYHYLLLIE